MPRGSFVMQQLFRVFKGLHEPSGVISSEGRLLLSFGGRLVHVLQYSSGTFKQVCAYGSGLDTIKKLGGLKLDMILTITMLHVHKSITIHSLKIVQNASPFHHVSSQTPSIRCRTLSLDTVNLNW